MVTTDVRIDWAIDYSGTGAVARVEVESGYYLINKTLFGTGVDHAARV